MLLLHLRQSISLLVKGKIAKPLDDGTHCKLSSHVRTLMIFVNRGYYFFYAGAETRVNELA